MTPALGHIPATNKQPPFSKSNVDIFARPPVREGSVAARAVANVAKSARSPKTHNAVLKGNCGWPIDPVAWANRAVASKKLQEQNNRMAQALQDAGEDVILSGGLTTISAITNVVETQIRCRAVRFLPVVAARDRRPMVNGMKLFMIENRNAHYFRYAVMTCNELIPASDNLRGPIQRLSRRISKWANEVCKENGIKVLYRGIEFTRATAGERDSEAQKQGRQSDLSSRYGAETVLYHLHANVLYWPTRVIDDWEQFLRDTHRFIGAEWKDNGKVESVEEIVKYCSKPADLEKATPSEFVWLYKQTERLKICQPLGDFKDWIRGLKARREKVVKVRRENGESQLMRVKKGKRGGSMDEEEDQNAEIEAWEDEGESNAESSELTLDRKKEAPDEGPAKNIVIGLSLPQWRHTPWAEPVIMVQNYDAATLSEEDGYYIREWQREAREWWDAARAPAPEKALEVARVALESLALGTKMSSNDIRKAAGAADYIVHTCGPTVPDIESELDSIPYIPPDEAVSAEPEVPPRSTDPNLDRGGGVDTHRDGFDMQPTPANIAEIAGERIRQRSEAIGQRAVVKAVVDELVESYGVRITEAEALRAANSAPDWQREIEAILPGRWLSRDESAALRMAA